MNLRNFGIYKFYVFVKKYFQLPVLIISTSSILFFCSNEKKETSSQEKIEIPDSAVIQNSELDTLPEQETNIYTIEKKEVVFFMINKNEMRSLMHEIGDSYRWETEALFNNFINQANTFQSILKKHNIKCVLSNNKQFEIKLKDGKIVSFNRLEKDQIMGEIISDGEKEPLIEFGMYSNTDLAKLIEEFYKIENLGYVQPDTAQAKQETQISP